MGGMEVTRLDFTCDTLNPNCCEWDDDWHQFRAGFTAIQSMVLFIGAISVLSMSWKKRARALLLVIQTSIECVQECGLIGSHDLHPLGLIGDWCVQIGHSYVARFVGFCHVPVGVDHV